MLRADTRISCLSGEFSALRACAAAMLVVFVVGLPLFWLVSLVRSRDEIKAEEPSGEASMKAQQFAFLVAAYKGDYYLWEVGEMWRKVVLTGLVSVVQPGSMLQVMVASTISLLFLVMHTRCWPYKDDNKNLLKLGAEVVIMMVFLLSALLRSVDTKQALVDDNILEEGDMTSEERAMPEVLSTLMVVFAAGLPFTRMLNTGGYRLLMIKIQIIHVF